MTIQVVDNTHFDSPIGCLEISVMDEAIVSIHFLDDEYGAIFSHTLHGTILERCVEELTEYFEGHRLSFDFPLLPRGTEFEKKVWKSLLGIPFGETCSYFDIASRMNNPNAVRAVGRANGANPIAIV